MSFTIIKPTQLRADRSPASAVERYADGSPKVWTACAQCDRSGRVPGARAGTTKKCPACSGQGAKAAKYSRTTTYIDVLEDKSNVAKWLVRMTALGLHASPELVAKVGEVDDPNGEGREALQKLCTEAQERANSDLKAITGTALHEVTEELDRGNLDVFVPEDFAASIEAYRIVTMDCEMLGIEEFAVQDELRVAGTLDRGLKVYGELAARMAVPEGTAMIGDLKSGRIDYGFGKIVMQLAMYSRMQRYDPVTWERSPLLFDGTPVSTSVGALIHMPSDGTHAAVYKLDLDRGWADVQLARQVRDVRNYWNRVGNKPLALVHHDGAI
ncbi:MAG: hypothetical protein ACRCYU_12285 [Nocardioides sp.]